MVSAIILIKCDKSSINQTAEALASMPGISEVYSVSGRVDLVAIVRVPNNDALAQIVTNQMLSVPGISRTETLIAFRAFSKLDLEKMFSIGMESEQA